MLFLSFVSIFVFAYNAQKNAQNNVLLCWKHAYLGEKLLFFLQFNLIFSNLITAVSTDVGIQIHLWELLPLIYINLRLLSSTFMTDVAMISNVTYRDNETAEQKLIIFWFRLQ